MSQPARVSSKNKVTPKFASDDERASYYQKIMEDSDDEVTKIQVEGEELSDAPAWLRAALAMMDADDTGELDKAEVVYFMKRIRKLIQSKKNDTGELDYQDFPESVKNALAVWDADASGSVSVGELTAAANAQKKMQEENRMMKKAIIALVGIIVLLAVMNFVMGLLAVEAGKDTVPASSSSHRRRRLSDLAETYGAHRILHADVGGGAERSLGAGVMVTGSGMSGEQDAKDTTVMGTSEAKERYQDLVVMEKLATIPNDLAGSIKSVTFPSPVGPKTFKEITAIDMGPADPEMGMRKIFRSPKGDFVLIEPPRNTSAACYERFIEFKDPKSGNIETVTEEMIRTRGKYFCAGYDKNVHDGGRCREAHEWDMGYTEPAPVYSSENATGVVACDLVAASITLSTEGDQQAGVANVMVPNLYQHCPSGACNMTEFFSYLQAAPMDGPPGMTMMDAWMRFNRDNDTFVTMDELKAGMTAALPNFNLMWNNTVMRSPQTVRMVESANRTATKTSRRRLEADLLSGNYRRRMLTYLHPESGEKVRRLQQSAASGVYITTAVQYAVKTQAMTDTDFATTMPVTQVAEAVCSADASKCGPGAEAMVAAADTNKDGKIDTQEYADKLPQKLSSDPAVKAEQDSAPEPKTGPSVCSALKEALPPAIGLTCTNEKDLEKMKGENIAEKMSACDMADRFSGELADGKMDNEECKKLFDPATPFDEMLMICSGGDPETLQKCKSQGVGMSHCVALVLKETGNDKDAAEMVCHMHDYMDPVATPTSGLTRAEVDIGFNKLKHEHMGAEASAEIRRMLGAGQMKRNPHKRHALEVQHLGPFHRDSTGKKQETGFHEVVFEQMINLPRMRMLEHQTIQKERKLRMAKARKLDAESFDKWILERRLKSSEKLRRRRVLLAFDEEKDDPEVAHRKLQRVNRRLHEISINAHSHRALEQTGRRLVADDDEEDRKLRFLLDDDYHLLSDNHAEYRRDFRIKPTSFEMRELMHLTHAAKRNLAHELPSMSDVADYMTEQVGKSGGVTRDAVVQWAANTLATIAAADPDPVNNPNATFTAADLQASRQEMRVLQKVRDAQDPVGTVKQFNSFASPQTPDDAQEELEDMNGGVQPTQTFAKFNTDGDTAETASAGMRKLMSQRRVLTEIAERRRMRALEMQEGDHVRRHLLASVDELHRVLHDNEAQATMATTPVMNEKEVSNAFNKKPGMMAKVKEHCKREGKKREAAVLTENRRILSQIKLEPFERRELKQSDDDDEDDEGSFQCTPCDMLTATSDAARQHLEQLQVNKDAKDAGDPNWCAADYENYKAICMDKEECCSVKPDAPLNATMPDASEGTAGGIPGTYGAGAAAGTTGTGTGSHAGHSHNRQLFMPAANAGFMANLATVWGQLAGQGNMILQSMGNPPVYPVDAPPTAAAPAVGTNPRTSFTMPTSASFVTMANRGMNGRRNLFGAPGTAGDPVDASAKPVAGEIMDYHKCATGKSVAKQGEQPEMGPLPGMEMDETVPTNRRMLGAKHHFLAHFEQRQRQKHSHNHFAGASTRSLTENTHPHPIDMFRHKRRSVPYKQLLREQEKERLRRRRMQQLDGDQFSMEDPEPTVHVDGSGRRLMIWDQTTCDGAVEPSVQYECMTGATRSQAMEMQSPNNVNTAAGDPKPVPAQQQQPLTFVSFVNRAMSDGEGGLPACQKLPLEERKMPMMGATNNFDLDPVNTYAHNLQVDKMGPGREIGFGQRVQVQERDRVPLHAAEEEVPRCDLSAWREIGGYEPVNKPTGQSTPTQRRQRRLQERRSLRNYRLTSNNFRKLSRQDVKALRHENKMRRERRRARARRVLGSEEKARQLDAFEHEFYHKFGSRHRSMRVLTGKTGETFRNLQMIETYHTNVRRLRQRELLEGIKKRQRQLYDPTMMASTPMPHTMDAVADPGDPTPFGTLPPGSGATAAPLVLPQQGMGSSSSPPPPTYAEAHNPVSYSTMPPTGQTSTVSPNMLMATTEPPAYYGPTGGEPITLTKIMNHNLFDQSSNKFYQLMITYVNKTKDSTAWHTHDLCYYAMAWNTNSTTLGADGFPVGNNKIENECTKAVVYDPEQFGYSPQLFEEYHPGMSFCPMEDDVEDMDPEGVLYKTNEMMMDADRKGWEHAVNHLEDLPAGYKCEAGLPVPDDAFSEAESDDDEREPPLPAEVKEQACGNICMSPGDGSMKKKIDELVEGYMHFPDTCKDYTKMYLGLPGYDPETGMDEGAEQAEQYCGGFSATPIYSVLSYEAAEAFGSEFKREKLRHPILADFLNMEEMKPCVSPGVQERAHLEHMVSKHGDADLHEAIFHQIPMGEMRAQVPKKKANSGGLWAALNPPDKKDPTLVGFVTMTDLSNYESKCTDAAGNKETVDQKACEQLHLVMPVIAQLFAAPAGGVPGNAGAAAEMPPASEMAAATRISHEDLMKFLEMAEEGNAAAVKGEEVTVDDYVCQALMTEKSGCKTAECEKANFYEQSGGKTKMPVQKMHTPAGVVGGIDANSEVKMPADEDTKKAEEDAAQRDMAVAENLKQAFADAKKDTEALTSAVVHTGRRVLLMRARALSEDGFARPEHFRRALKEMEPALRRSLMTHDSTKLEIEAAADKYVTNDAGADVTDGFGKKIPKPAAGEAPSPQLLTTVGVPESFLDKTCDALTNVLKNVNSTVLQMRSSTKGMTEDPETERQRHENIDAQEKFQKRITSEGAEFIAFCKNMTMQHLKDDMEEREAVRNATKVTLEKRSSDATFVPAAAPKDDPDAVKEEVAPRTIPYEQAASMTKALDMMQGGDEAPPADVLEPEEFTTNKKEFMDGCAPGKVAAAVPPEDASAECEAEWETMTKDNPNANSGGEEDVIPKRKLTETAAPKTGEIENPISCDSDEAEVVLPAAMSANSNGAAAEIYSGAAMDLRHLLTAQLRNAKTKSTRKRALQERLDNLVDSEETEFAAISFGPRRLNKVLLLDSAIDYGSRRKLLTNPGEKQMIRPSATGSHKLSCPEQKIITEGAQVPAQMTFDNLDEGAQQMAQGDSKAIKAHAEQTAQAGSVANDGYNPADALDTGMGGCCSTCACGAAHQHEAPYVDSMDMYDDRRQRRLYERSVYRQDYMVGQNRRQLPDAEMTGGKSAAFQMPGNDGTTFSPEMNAIQMATTMPAAKGSAFTTMSPTQMMNTFYGGTFSSTTVMPAAGAAATAASTPMWETSTYMPTSAPYTMPEFNQFPDMMATTGAPLQMDNAAQAAAMSTVNMMATAAPKTMPAFVPAAMTKGPNNTMQTQVSANDFKEVPMPGNETKLMTAYTGSNVSLINMFNNGTYYGDGANPAVTPEQNAAQNEQYADTQKSQAKPTVDPAATDAIQSQMGFDGDSYVPAEVGDGFDCNKMPATPFSAQVSNPTTGATVTTQLDLSEECKHKQKMQKYAKKIEAVILELTERKATQEAVAMLGISTRRRLAQGKNVPSYIRKLTSIPQQHHVEEYRRVLQSRGVDHRKLMFETEIIDMMSGDRNHTVDSDLPKTNISESVPSKSPAAMPTAAEAKYKETIEDISAMATSLHNQIDPEFLAEVKRAVAAAREFSFDVYMRMRADPAYLQTLMNVGLDQKEKLELMRGVRDMAGMVSPSEPDWQAEQYDGDKCMQLSPRHLGCADLRQMSYKQTEYTLDQGPANAALGETGEQHEPEVIDTFDRPHRKCQDLADDTRRALSGNGPTDLANPMLEAMSQVLQRVTDYDAPQNLWMSKTWCNSDPCTYTLPTDTDITNICEYTYEETNSWGAYDITTWEQKTKPNYRPIKDILGCPGAAGTNWDGTGYRAGGYMRCYEAKTNYKKACGDMLKGIRDAVQKDPASNTYKDYEDSVTGQYRYAGYEMHQLAQALNIEIDMHLLDPYYVQYYDPANPESSFMGEMKPISTRLARCAIREVRENIPEKKVQEFLGRMKNGEIAAEEIAERMLKPALEKKTNTTSNVREAMAFLQKNVTSLCKRFCMKHKQWADVSAGLQNGVAGKTAEPTFSDADFPGASDPSEPECRTDNQCQLYYELESPVVKKQTQDQYANIARLRQRRVRRLQIQERRRRLEEKEGGAEKQKACVNIDNREFCAKDGSGVSAEEAEERRLADHWEERGIDYLIPAVDPLHRGYASKTSGVKSNSRRGVGTTISRAQMHKRRQR
eukprot:CAMPEP_0179006190 /NCGR_PEP_ID=MMETSP0795-20121207/14397_1 /TAXON_ID=88552 /ORGANISM="Amoebophrya sp., Strain Ameob2" /LENGTH=4148 /DNA_ID=CAMNT_0020700885 /DNA_START=196 /DNA_END=12644 /DNA_ORIENTATION=-